MIEKCYQEDGIILEKLKKWNNIISGYDSYFWDCPRKPGKNGHLTRVTNNKTTRL